MQLLFSFKHMKTSEALSEFAENKVREKIEKFSTKPIEAHFTFSVDHVLHIAHCSVKGGDKFNFQVEAKSNDMYASIDLLVDKLETQLKRRKEKLKSHRNRTNLENVILLRPEIGPTDDCDSVPVDAADLLKYEKAKLAKVSGGN